jgi:hypothetical protein
VAASGRGKVDIIGGLEEIKKNVVAKQYKSQYEFTMALEQLVSVPIPKIFVHYDSNTS